MIGSAAFKPIEKSVRPRAVTVWILGDPLNLTKEERLLSGSIPVLSQAPRYTRFVAAIRRSRAASTSDGLGVKKLPDRVIILAW